MTLAKQIAECIKEPHTSDPTVNSIYKRAQTTEEGL